MITADNIEVFKHSSIRISGEGKVIYVDPFEIEDEAHDANIVFVTHDHYDHFSVEDIRKVSNYDTVVVVPKSLARKAMKMCTCSEDAFLARSYVMEPKSFREIQGLEVSAIAAYNVLKPYHPKINGWLGYIIKIDGKRIYIAGDTDLTKEAKAVKCDIALVPIGGNYTMDAKKAAELVNTINPEIAIPTHYGSIVGKPEDEEIFAKNVNKSIRVEFKIPFEGQ